MHTPLPDPVLAQRIVATLHHGIEKHYAGRYQEAVEIYSRVLEVDPLSGDALYLGGVSLRQSQRPEAAIAWLRLAMQVTPGRGVIHNALGNVLRDLQRLEEAWVCFLRSVVLDPNLLGGWDALASTSFALGRIEMVVAAYESLLTLDPADANACHGLGVALKRLGRYEAAVAAYDRACQIKPDNPMTWYYRGLSLGMLDRSEEAFASYEKAVALDPHLADAYINMATFLQDRRQLEPARALYNKVVAMDPDSSDVHSNLMLCMQYLPGVTPEWNAQIHRRWDQRHGQPLKAAWKPHPNVPNPERRLRLGFISADLGRHPVGYFLARVLAHLDPAQVETFLYSDRVKPGTVTRRVPDPSSRDEMTDRLESMAHHWCDSVSLSAVELAARVRQDRIDILFDLSGHTANNRLITFAHKPAPVQATWAGYVGTTGLEAMDYLVADRFHVLPEHEPFIQEKVLRLPDGYICYDPPVYAPPVGPLPMLANGFVTFGGFNNPTKLMPETVAVWAQILAAIPGSRLLMHYRGLEKPFIQGWIRESFAQYGVEPARLELNPAVAHPELLGAYNRVDIALDTFPYSGGLTTCEALWMGVPVITKPGDLFSSRHSYSHLSNVGLGGTVARDNAHYHAIATALARNPDNLARIRGSLRAHMAASPLCDGRRFATGFQQALREIWRKWCQERSATTSS